MKEFLHVGIPTNIAREGEIFEPNNKIHIITPDTNEYHIEYLRFEEDSPLPQELKTMMHVAYKVDDMDKQLAENIVVVAPWQSDEHTRLAFIMKDGMLFELAEEIR